MILSDFISTLVDMLPEHNSLKNPNNQLRQVLDNSAGAWFDNRNVQDFYESLYLQSATGKWLDLHGKDYGVTRREDETDDDYRQRIIQDVMERLTPAYLEELFDLTVYSYVADFDPTDNTLTSDNPYLNKQGYMATADEDTENFLNDKFVLGGGLTWF